MCAYPSALVLKIVMYLSSGLKTWYGSSRASVFEIQRRILKPPKDFINTYIAYPIRWPTSAVKVSKLGSTRDSVLPYPTRDNGERLDARNVTRKALTWMKTIFCVQGETSVAKLDFFFSEDRLFLSLHVREVQIRVSIGIRILFFLMIEVTMSRARNSVSVGLASTSAAIRDVRTLTSSHERCPARTCARRGGRETSLVKAAASLSDRYQGWGRTWT